MSDASLPLVSIITPVYNGAKYLDELIKSVQQQDYPLIEHIIIDDGSTDNGATLTVLERYPQLRWWTRPNRGQYATMNEGLLAAKGEIFCFISADDKVAEGAVQQVVEMLRKYPEVGAIYGRYCLINAEGKAIRYLQPFQNASTDLYPYCLHISHSSFYIRRNIILTNNLLFDDKLHFVGDYDWFLRVFRSNLHILHIRDNLSIIRIHTSQSTNKNFYPMRAEMLSVQRKNGVSFFWASVFRKILFLTRLINTAQNHSIRNALYISFDRIAKKPGI